MYGTLNNLRNYYGPDAKESIQNAICKLTKVKEANINLSKIIELSRPVSLSPDELLGHENQVDSSEDYKDNIMKLDEGWDFSKKSHKQQAE